MIEPIYYNGYNYGTSYISNNYSKKKIKKQASLRKIPSIM